MGVEGATQGSTCTFPRTSQQRCLQPFLEHCVTDTLLLLTSPYPHKQPLKSLHLQGDVCPLLPSDATPRPPPVPVLWPCPCLVMSSPSSVFPCFPLSLGLYFLVFYPCFLHPVFHCLKGSRHYNYLSSPCSAFFSLSTLWGKRTLSVSFFLKVIWLDYSFNRVNKK